MWYKKEIQTGKGLKSTTRKKKKSTERPTKAKKEFRER